MVRPLRIEYPGAWYHVMNRVAGRKLLFREEPILRLFVDTLGESLDRFEVGCHAWCLMGNHYHLLLHTPCGNLSRVMRHLNGVFTQRFNRRNRLDGPLFRGRYRAQLIERDAYLLRVSRYIHRNPLEAGLVADLSRCRWTSFPGYIERTKAKPWLVTAEVLAQVGGSRARYRHYVETPEADDMTVEDRLLPVLGSGAFRTEALAGAGSDREIERPKTERPGADEVLERVAQAFGTERGQLLRAQRGRGRRNPARAAAMKLCLWRTGLTQAEVARVFGVGHYATVAMTVRRLEGWMDSDLKLRRRVEALQREWDER